MSIYFSNYVRQGKKTFKIKKLEAGKYTAHVSYQYGYFNGDKFEGLSFYYKKYEYIERDEDDRDGIGGTSLETDVIVMLGTYVDWVEHGYCTALPDTNDRFAKTGYYNHHSYVTEKEAEELGLEKKQIPLEEYTFENGQKMPVDPIDEDGFSVLREMDFFREGNFRYTLTEGQFVGGKLNGLGTTCYDSDVNGDSQYIRKSGVFKDGELVFGYRYVYSADGESKEYFGYADGRDIDEYGEEIVYEGKRYIGEAVNGVPCGIGCLFQGKNKMLKGTFKDGKLHGIGCTYRKVDGKWFPFDFKLKYVFKELLDENDYPNDSWGIFVNGKYQSDMTWEEFFDAYSDVKKV